MASQIPPIIADWAPKNAPEPNERTHHAEERTHAAGRSLLHKNARLACRTMMFFFFLSVTAAIFRAKNAPGGFFDVAQEMGTAECTDAH